MAHIYEAIFGKFSFDQFTLNHGDANLFYFTSGGKNSINDKLIALLEKGRGQFEVGFPEYEIPPLEPLFIEHFHTYVDQKAVIKADVNFNDIYMSGLKQFIIEDLNFRISGLTLSFEFTLPQLILTSTYKIDGKVAGFIPFKPKGDARVEANDVKIKGVATLGVKDGYLNLKSFAGQFDMKKIKIYMSGLIGDGLINKIVNLILSKISTNIIQEQKDALAEYASELIFEVANEFLQNFKLTDILC